MKLNMIKENNEQPIIYVLVGLPGSGKSTWSNTINKDASFEIISSDDIIEKMAANDGLTYSEGFDKFIGIATKQANQKFYDALKHKRNIIYDKTNMGKKRRASILSALPVEYKKVAVVFTVDDSELSRRLKNRAETTGKNIPDYIIKDMSKRYEEPTKTEGFDDIIHVNG